MPLRYVTGCAGALKERLFEELRGALAAPGEHALILLVPAQYTLQAELDVTDALDLPGSFRLQVLSPERLCTRVFEAAGAPARARVDEQGRVMLMHEALKSAEGELRRYRAALNRTGFAQRAVRQISQFKQAGFAPEDLRALSDKQPDGMLKSKARDLSILYAAYEAVLAGRFLDGEDVTRCAVERSGRAPFLAGAQVWVYGFDLLTQSLNQWILKLCAVCQQVSLLVALKGGARDAALYRPVQHSLDRLSQAAAREGITWRREELKSPEGGEQSALEHLEAELYRMPPRKRPGQPAGIRLAMLKNPKAEAEYAAAACRYLVRTQGLHWRDVAVACQNLTDEYEGALRRAFRLYDVPLFLATARPADRHPLAACLLGALRLITGNFQTDDMTLYLRTGYAGLNPDECDALIACAVRYGLRGRRWLTAFSSANEALTMAVEPLRARAVEPVIQLREALKRQGAQARLQALFDFLEALNAREALERDQRRLIEAGMRESAAEGAQVWNRLIAALDQMAELMPDAALGARELYELLSRSLAASEIRSIPQSGDAVEGGGIERLKGRPVRALFVLGANEEGKAGAGGLLSDVELSALEREADCWLGLDAADLSRMAQLSVKSLLSLTRKYLFVTYAQSDASGAARSPGALVQSIRRVFPDLNARGGVAGGAISAETLLEAPEAAAAYAPARILEQEAAGRAIRALAQSGAHERAIERMRSALHFAVRSEILPPALSRKVLGQLNRISASRLERFAQCPFQHFASYALKPEEFKPFELSPRDAGNFYHEALEMFLRENGQQIGALSPDEGARRMDELTDHLVERMLDQPGADSALYRAEAARLRSVARRAARTVVAQFDGSHFRPVQMEVDLDLDEARLPLGEAAVLAGRIDRIDEWDGEAGRFLRVVDYKTGGKKLSLSEIYHGLQLQLIVYLAAALNRRGGRPAGVFYFSVADPIIATDSLDAGEVEKLRAKELRLDGLIQRDRRVIEAMTADPERALALTLNRDGTPRASEKLLSDQDFSLLIGRALERAASWIEGIRAGDTRIAPAEAGGRRACEFCDYAALCQFDKKLPGARARRFPKLSGKQVLAKLRGEEDEAEEGEEQPDAGG